MMTTPGLPRWLIKSSSQRCPHFNGFSYFPMVYMCHSSTNDTNNPLSQQRSCYLSSAFRFQLEILSIFFSCFFAITLECCLLHLISAKPLKLLHKVGKNTIFAGSGSVKTIIYKSHIISALNLRPLSEQPGLSL